MEKGIFVRKSWWTRHGRCLGLYQRGDVCVRLDCLVEWSSDGRLRGGSVGGNCFGGLEREKISEEVDERDVCDGESGAGGNLLLL